MDGHCDGLPVHFMQMHGLAHLEEPAQQSRVVQHRMTLQVTNARCWYAGVYRWMRRWAAAQSDRPSSLWPSRAGTSESCAGDNAAASCCRPRRRRCSSSIGTVGAAQMIHRGQTMPQVRQVCSPSPSAVFTYYAAACLPKRPVVCLQHSSLSVDSLKPSFNSPTHPPRRAPHLHAP